MFKAHEMNDLLSRKVDKFDLNDLLKGKTSKKDFSMLQDQVVTLHKKIGQLGHVVHQMLKIKTDIKC